MRTGERMIAVSASSASASMSTVGSANRRESSRWWALAAVSLATFMTYLDAIVVKVRDNHVVQNKPDF